MRARRFSSAFFAAAIAGIHDHSNNRPATATALPSKHRARATRRAQEGGNGGGSDDPCTLCVDGGEFDPDLRIGTVRCQEVQDLLVESTPASSSVCVDAQLQGYLYCSCAAYPADVYCSMCENGTIELANPTLVPSNGLAPKTCQEALFAKLTDNEECRLIAEAAEECGCAAAAAPNCTLCGTGAVQSPDRALPPDFVRTCQDYSDLAAAAAGNATECDALTADLPVDPRAYCGCPDADDPPDDAACPAGLCDDGDILTNPDAAVKVAADPDQTVTLTCQDVFDMAKAAVDEGYCEDLRGYASECCGPQDSENNPASPTAAGSTSAPGPAPGASTPTSGVAAAAKQTAKMHLQGALLLQAANMLLAVLFG